MKKVTSLALIVSLLMMTMIIAPITAGAVASLPVSDNFDGSTIDTTKWDKVSKPNQSPGASITDGSTYGATGNVLKLDGADYNNFGIKTTNCIPSAFVVKFDVYLADNYAGSELKLKGGSNDELLYIKKDTITYTSNAGGINIPITTGKWYNVKFTLNTTTKATSTTVTPAGGTPTTVSGTFGTINPANEIYFQGFYMNAKSTFALVDNMTIEEYVAPTHKLPIEDDFSGDAIDTDKWNTITATTGSENSQITLSDGALKIYDIYQNVGIGTTLDEAITEGTIRFKYDIYASSEFMNHTEIKNGQPSVVNSEIVLCGGSGISDANAITFFKPNGMTIRGVSGNIFVPVEDTWYTIETTLDVETQNVIVVATDGENTWSKSGKCSSTNLASTSQISFGGKWMNVGTKSHVLVDNVSIEEYVPPVEIWSVSDDFNTGTEIDKTKWNKNTYANETQGVNLIDGASYNTTGGIVKMDKYYSRIGVKPTTPPASFRVVYDLYMPTGFGSEIQLKGGSNDVYLWLRDSRLYYSKGNIGTPLTGNTWYTVECEVDVTGKSSTTVVTPKDGGASVSFTGTFDIINTANEIYFQAHNDANNPFYIDNLTIEETLSVPKSDSVKVVKYDNTTSTNLTNVSAGTKEIVVGFSADVDDDTLSDDTITFVNKTTNKSVEYIGTYDKTAKTWTIPIGTLYLDPSSTYELTVTSAVQNENGESAPLFRYAFTTDAGEFKADLAVYKGDTRITKLSELSDGDVVIVKAEVVNTTGKDQNLLMLYAGYNTNKVTQSQVFNKTIKATDKNITVEEFTVTVDKTNLTHIKFFGWNNYQPVKSLTVSDNIIQ